MTGIGIGGIGIGAPGKGIAGNLKLLTHIFYIFRNVLACYAIT